MNCQFSPLDAADFDDMYAIMKQAFPDTEMREYEGQKELLQYDDYRIYGAKDEEGHLIAFIAAWEPGDFLYLEHFAVEECCRGDGMGGKILLDFLKQKDMPIILEVELPETDIAKRRIGFYQRAGFALNTYEYLQPPYRIGQSPLPLYFMTYPDAIDENKFQEYKKFLYDVVYRAGVK